MKGGREEGGGGRGEVEGERGKGKGAVCMWLD